MPQFLSQPTSIYHPLRVIDHRQVEFLINGNFYHWQRGTGPVSVDGSFTDDGFSYPILADRVFVRPAGATCTQERSTTVPANGKAEYSLKVTGNTSLTTVEVGQRIPASLAYKRRLTFSCWIYNATGTSQTPIFRVDTPSAKNSWTSQTIRLSDNLQACANNAWTQVSYTFDPSAYTNMGNGLEVRFRITSGMNSNTKYILVSQMSLISGDVVSFWPPDPEEDFTKCLRYALIISDANFSSQFPRWDGYGISTSHPYETFSFPVPMVRIPTFSPSLGVYSVNLSGLPGFVANRFGLKVDFDLDQSANYTVYRNADWWFSAELV